MKDGNGGVDVIEFGQVKACSQINSVIESVAQVQVQYTEYNEDIGALM